MEKDLSEARLLVGQYEAKMKSLNESIKDLDGKKRQLEEQVDTLNEVQIIFYSYLFINYIINKIYTDLHKYRHTTFLAGIIYRISSYSFRS